MKTLIKHKKRRGRRPKFVPDVNGNDVVGLSYDKHNNRYYYTFWKRDGVGKGNFGRGDYLLALFEFRNWLKSREGEEEYIPVPGAEEIIVERREPIDIDESQYSPEIRKEWEGKRDIVNSCG